MISEHGGAISMPMYRQLVWKSSLARAVSGRSAPYLTARLLGVPPPPPDQTLSLISTDCDRGYTYVRGDWVLPCVSRLFLVPDPDFDRLESSYADMLMVGVFANQWAPTAGRAASVQEWRSHFGAWCSKMICPLRSEKSIIFTAV